MSPDDSSVEIPGDAPDESATVTLQASDGPAEAYLVGQGPGVLFIIDAIGLRPRIRAMCGEIAGWGYTVLAPNVLYRSGTAQETSPAEDLREPGARERFFEQAMPRVGQLTPPRIDADLPAYLSALRAHASGEEVAVVGYCMGVRIAVRAAAADPEVVAVAGFHGGRLVTDDEGSPHRVLPQARAEFVFGHASNDRSMPPEQVEALGRALDEAGLSATNEVYDGPHGFTMADTSMYDEPSARRAMSALHDLLQRTLGQ